MTGRRASNRRRKTPFHDEQHSGERPLGREHVELQSARTGEVGFEYLFGEHVRKDGASARASRLQFSLKYDLLY